MAKKAAQLATTLGFEEAAERLQEPWPKKRKLTSSVQGMSYPFTIVPPFGCSTCPVI